MPYKLNAITGKMGVVNEEQDTSDLVVGPSSSTDDAVVRFDGTSGVLVQNSGTTLSDSDELATGSLTLTTDLAVSQSRSEVSTSPDCPGSTVD